MHYISVGTFTSDLRTHGKRCMTKSDIFIIPVAPLRQQAVVTATRKAVAGGLRLGILDNSKGNADHLLGMLVEGVRAVVPVSSVLMRRKGSAAAGAERDMIEELAANADFVVSAMAD